MKLKKNIQYGLLGGLALNILVLLPDYISLLLPDELFHAMMYVYIFTGAVLAMLIVGYGYDSVPLSLSRTLVMYLAGVLIFVLTVQSGLIQFIDGLMHYERYDDGYGVGILMLIMLMLSVCGGVAASVVVPIFRYIQNRFLHKNLPM